MRQFFFFKSLFVLSPCFVFCTQGHSLHPRFGPTEQKTVFISRRPLPLCPEWKSACMGACVKCEVTSAFEPCVCLCLCVSCDDVYSRCDC